MRVAFFTDSFHEINGVAHTSRNLDAFARRRNLPFLSVHAGATTELRRTGNHLELSLKRTVLGIPLDNNMSFDLFFARHWRRTMQAFRDFQPDVVHITGPSDVGILGAVAAKHMGVPILASWHTNLHEYAGTRLGSIVGAFLGESSRSKLEQFAESKALDALSLYYRMGRLLLAPNEELRRMLEQKTGRPCQLMHRGVERDLFHPLRRTRRDATLVLGFCGRLRPEKNVRLLVKLEEMLLAEGVTNYKFLIVGDGSEREWLRQNLKSVELPGVLRGEQLAEAYANMDVFLFPSWTDTFGNVILESLACGTPCVVNTGGGPKFLVENEVTGMIASSDAKFVAAAASLARNPEHRFRLREGALQSKFVQSWDEVFERLYRSYSECAARTTLSTAIRQPEVV
ncbi:glycosyltransferase [Bryobacter aggregatus]|uniref:glycosyltransferase n=1 Tax=Bryobacter aggregatus TaxID=360054 RepID=UPI00068F86C4|nr:glycosyltransferase [Bryobacter aggregatus]